MGLVPVPRPREKAACLPVPLETAQHFLLAVASFGVQLRGTAGDHGGGELGGEGCESKPRPQPSAHRTDQLGASPLPAPPHPLGRVSRPAGPPLWRSCPADTETPSLLSPGTWGCALTEAPGGRRRAKWDNLHAGRVSAQAQRGKERDAVWANLYKNATCRRSELATVCRRTGKKKQNKTAV